MYQRKATPKFYPDPCYHWCPTCQQDWTHPVLYSKVSSPLDVWRAECRDCKADRRVRSRGTKTNVSRV